jgi:putative oxidoreductase
MTDTILALYHIFPDGRSGFALLLLRVFVGVAFVFHGSGKSRDVAAFAAEFGVPKPLAVAGAYTQLACGLLLLAGLATPLAGVAIASTMAVAVAKLIARGERFVNPDGHSWEAAGFYFVACAALTLLGPGAYSLDKAVFAG